MKLIRSQDLNSIPLSFDTIYNTERVKGNFIRFNSKVRPDR
jgi:hypothetical protein